VEGGARLIRSDAAERRRVDRLVHRVLSVGTACAAFLLVVGIATALVRDHSLPRATIPLSAMPRALAHLDPAGLISAGLAALIFTPVARVFGSILAFLTSRDLPYTLITIAVLSLMGVSLWLGSG
jgi:uncharacterized membrane protein